MSLRHSLECVGSHFFRYRSYLPLLLLPLAVDAFASFSLLQGSPEATQAWQWLCLGVSLSGLAVRILTVGFVPRHTSGRNTTGQVAASLNTTGIYSLVRHPLYLGNYLIFLGFTLFFHSWRFTLLSTCLFALYYERIMLAEEDFLRTKFGQDFEFWAARTPTIIPRFSNWKPPALPFSWRSVFAREYSVVLLIAAIFWTQDVIGHSLVQGRVEISWPWSALLMVGAAVYLVLMILKKHTPYLRAAGR